MSLCTKSSRTIQSRPNITRIYFPRSQLFTPAVRYSFELGNLSRVIAISEGGCTASRFKGNNLRTTVRLSQKTSAGGYPRKTRRSVSDRAQPICEHTHAVGSAFPQEWRSLSLCQIAHRNALDRLACSPKACSIVISVSWPDEGEGEETQDPRNDRSAIHWSRSFESCVTATRYSMLRKTLRPYCERGRSTKARTTAGGWNEGRGSSALEDENRCIEEVAAELTLDNRMRSSCGGVLSGGKCWG